MTAANGNDRAGMHIFHGAGAQGHGGLANPPCLQSVACNRDSNDGAGAREA
jgi:hypothetical protein